MKRADREIRRIETGDAYYSVRSSGKVLVRKKRTRRHWLRRGAGSWRVCGGEELLRAAIDFEKAKRGEP